MGFELKIGGVFTSYFRVQTTPYYAGITRVLHGITRYYTVLHGITEYYPGITRYYRAGNTPYYRVLPGIPGHCVQGITQVNTPSLKIKEDIK